MKMRDVHQEVRDGVHMPGVFVVVCPPMLQAGRGVRCALPLRLDDGAA
jgi:hypothetical protein